MQKKPFLALYEKSKIKSTNELSVGTESEGETSDVDEYYLDGTLITESLEADDEDNYILGSTFQTDSIEDSDTDEFIID
jgi:hypothetical protein